MDRRIAQGFLLAAALAVTGATNLVAQNPASPPAQTGAPAYRFRLLGVYDEKSGDPIEGVEVTDILNHNGSLTSATGTLSLFFLPDGGALVQLRKVGYASQTMTITISPSDTTPVTVVMTRATELPAVVVRDSATGHVSAKMASFEEHRKLGFGSFITEAELRKADSHSFVNLLASRLPGIQMVAGRTSSTYLVSSRKQCNGPVFLKKCTIPNCYVRVFVDGILTYDNNMGTNALPDFARFNTIDYQSVEFYPGGSALPSGISPSGNDCGTLVLTTRER